MSKDKVGDKLKIYYNPHNPSNVTQTKSLVLPIVMIACGIVFLIGGILSGVKNK